MPIQSHSEPAGPKLKLNLRPLWSVLATALFSGFVVAGYILADKAGVFLRAGFAQDDIDTTFGFLVGLLTGVVVAVAVLAIWRARSSCSAESLRQHIDEHHRRWRFLTCALLCFALNGTLWTSEIVAPLKPAAVMRLGAHVFMLLMLALLVCFGPGFLRKVYRETLNDELTRALRARALRLGYLTAIVVLAASFLLTVYNPVITTAVMSWGLFSTIAVPALYFVILDWRAGRDG